MDGSTRNMRWPRSPGKASRRFCWRAARWTLLTSFADEVTALRAAREKCPETPFLLVSGTIGEEAAIQSLKSGATDYVLKSWPEHLAPAVRRAVELRHLPAEGERAREEQGLAQGDREVPRRTLPVERLEDLVRDGGGQPLPQVPDRVVVEAGFHPCRG